MAARKQTRTEIRPKLAGSLMFVLFENCKRKNERLNLLEIWNIYPMKVPS